MKDYSLRTVEGRSKQRARDGFVARALGREGETIFSVLLASTVPRSMAFCVWLGLAVSSSLTPGDLGMGRRGFTLVVVALVCAGLGSLRADFKLALAQGRLPDERG